MLYFEYKLGNRGKIMEEKNINDIKLEQAKAEKNFSLANTLKDAGIIMGGITAGAALVASLMGGSAAIVTEISNNTTLPAIYESDSYHASVRERERKLTDDLVNGNISYQDFKVALDKLYSIEEVVEYSKNTKDKEITSFVESYVKTKDMKETMFEKAVPLFLTNTVVGATIAVVAGKKRNKYMKQYEECGKELKEEEMSK